VRIGIASFSNEPGLVCERRRTSNFARSAARRRSIVAADIPINATATSSLSSSSPKRRSVGTNSPSTGASRLPVGAPKTAQQKRSAPMTSSPYSSGLGLRGATILGFNDCPSAFRAWLRCQPVVAPQLVEDSVLARLIRPLVPRRDRLGHRMPLTHRKSHPLGLTGPPKPARQACRTRAFQDESTTPPTRASLMSQRAA